MFLASVFFDGKGRKMAKEIDSTAIIEKNVELGEDVKIGPFAFIESGAVIGDRTVIGSSVWISGYARIGKENRIYHGSAIGGPPQDLKFDNEETIIEIGDRNSIREFACFHRGTKASGKTLIGNDNLLMAYVHVAHDCILGNHIILANSTNMGGHVEIQDYAIVGGLVPIHQFSRIGAYAMVGTGARIVQDVLPYALVGADPTRVVGINTVGLRRKGFSEKTIRAIKNAYKIIYHSGLNLTQAIERIKAELGDIPEVKRILDFIASSKRSIVR